MFDWNDTTNKIGDALVLKMWWELSISTLEELLLEDWNEMDDLSWIQINEIISFKKELL